MKGFSKAFAAAPSKQQNPTPGITRICPSNVKKIITYISLRSCTLRLLHLLVCLLYSHPLLCCETLELAKTALSALGLRTPSTSSTTGLSYTASAPYESDKKFLRLNKRALSHRDTQKQQTFKPAKSLKDYCDSTETNQTFKTLPNFLSSCRHLLCVQYRTSIYNLLETEKQTVGTRFAGTVTQTTINVRL